MQREVWDVVERCSTCGTVRVALVATYDQDESGDERCTVTRDRVPHSQSACDQMVTLMREQWPVLF